MQFFERPEGRTFTMEAYEAIGGLVGAIATKASEVLSSLEEEVRGAFGRVFAELVHLDRDRPPTRRRAALSTFSSNKGAIQLIKALDGPECRLLVTSGSGQETTVEVAHEKLFTAWPKLKLWIDESGDALREIDHADEEARRWQKEGDNPQELWLGSRAKKVLTAIERFGKSLSPKLERFLKPLQMLIAKLDEDLSYQERLLIGQKLTEFGDPRPGVGVKDGVPDIDWIEIPGGSIKLEGGDHVFEVKPFGIAKYPVTNAQFETFLNAEDGYRRKKWWRDIDTSEEPTKPSWHEANGPCETVSWYEAIAFSLWLRAKTGTSIRLPAEWEWQQAATGGDPERNYPWEGERDDSRCNSAESRLSRETANGMYPTGVTAQRMFDMAGNVWEWCLNEYENPERPEAGHINNKGSQRVVRCGSWSIPPVYLGVSDRGRIDADLRFP